MDTLVLITTLTFLEQCMSSYAITHARALHLLDFLESKLHKTLKHELPESINQASYHSFNGDIRQSPTYIHSKFIKVFTENEGKYLGSNDNRYVINTHSKAKRFFQYSPYVLETPRVISKPAPASTSVNVKGSQTKAPKVKPFVDHFAGIRSWAIPFFNLRQKPSNNDRRNYKDQHDEYSREVFDSIVNDEHTDKHTSRDNKLFSELKHLEELAASREIASSHEQNKVSLNHLYDPTSRSKSKQNIDSGTMPPQDQLEGFGNTNKEPTGFFDEQPAVETRDGFNKKFEPSSSQNYFNDDSESESGFGDQFYNPDYDYDYGWGDEYGFFDTTSDDCDNIETKTCKTDNECNCYGIYFCTNGRCQTSGTQTSTQNNSPFDNGFWHDGPVF